MNESDNPESNDEEQLVAYLDGELSPEHAEAVEQRLGSDDAFRSLLARIQSTWDMLDELPQPTLDEKFTQSTVEMVAVTLSETTKTEAMSVRQKNALKRVGWLAAAAASLAIGFLSVRHFQSQQDRDLLRDLPVIERIDQYTEVEDVEFLISLYDAGLFVDDELRAELPADGQ